MVDRNSSTNAAPSANEIMNSRCRWSRQVASKGPASAAHDRAIAAVAAASRCALGSTETSRSAMAGGNGLFAATATDLAQLMSRLSWPKSVLSIR